jgi:hypothetical protein
MKKILILVFVMTTLSAVAGSFGDGEQLSYGVSYRAALVPNINVMNITLRTVAENIAGVPHYHIVGNGRTGGFVKGFFNLNDTYHSWLDAQTLLPTRMTADVQEDSYRFRATYTYDWRAMSVSSVIRNARWNADRFYTMPLTSNSGDALSLLYRLRDINIDTLAKGTRYPLDLVLDNTTKPIYYTYLGREDIKIRKVGTFHAIKIRCTMATSDGATYEEGMELTAWVSDDANRIPLLIETPIRVGSVRVTISKWHTLSPLTSKIK